MVVVQSSALKDSAVLCAKAVEILCRSANRNIKTVEMRQKRMPKHCQNKTQLIALTRAYLTDVLAYRIVKTFYLKMVLFMHSIAHL